ncbi:DUF7266 family protein [Natrarchaeobius chitinivorans]|uniref:Secreted glycoprotein n=1 Tax=Natrarchaeobius chitinivorans TaxID=1679083 RepID=A0A3N6MMX0_NATCH|nr:hypothetical protein [Natrarchaeobius chitinivorans]RQG95836.1 hypothetical protein EA473_06510 [Natrarchaeobius chitinivorans]
MTDRALSYMVNYVLLLGVAVILVGGLSMAGSALLEGQHEQTVDAELDVIGERIAADISTADRLTQTEGEAETIRVVSDSPQFVSGGQYTITTETDGSDTIIRLESSDADVTKEKTINTTTPVDETRLTGGTLEISYDTGDDRLVITRE